MVQLKTAVNNVLRSSITKMIDGETREWPPKCLMFTYQPQRPKNISNPDKIFAPATQKRNMR